MSNFFVAAKSLKEALKACVLYFPDSNIEIITHTVVKRKLSVYEL